jgi:hypothetical protein
MLRFVVALVFFGSAFQALAATPYKRTLSVKSNSYLKDGVFIGGKAGEGTSLLGVRRAYSAKAKLERVIVDLGDQDARPAGMNPGYFQVSMDAATNRVILDLAQLRLSKVSEAQVQNLFRKSPYVADARLTLDPEDKAATMVLKLKRPMRMEVFQLKNKKKPGRVVIDLTPAVARSSFLPVSKKAKTAKKHAKAARREAFE